MPNFQGMYVDFDNNINSFTPVNRMYGDNLYGRSDLDEGCPYMSNRNSNTMISRCPLMFCDNHYSPVIRCITPYNNLNMVEDQYLGRVMPSQVSIRTVSIKDIQD